MVGLTILEDVVELVEGGVAAWIATCDASRAPMTARVMGTRVGATRRMLTCYVPNEQSGRTRENLTTSSQIAVFFCRVFDYRAVQIKGELLAIRSSESPDREHQARYLREFVAELEKIGHLQLHEQLTYWPSMAIELAVREVFVQTPGPGAGDPLRGPL